MLSILSFLLFLLLFHLFLVLEEFFLYLGGNYLYDAELFFAQARDGGFLVGRLYNAFSGLSVAFLGFVGE